MRKISLVGKRFGMLTVESELDFGHYSCVCDCGGKIIPHKHNLRNGNTKSCGCLRSLAKLGPKNPAWRGSAVKYDALHEWIRHRYVKPDLCECCYLAPPRDLANKSGNYLRELSDWQYLCRRCHMLSDGRIRKGGVGNGNVVNI